MKIVATILDGRARVHVAATRAPDLLRRQIAAQTGDALLVAVALAPPGLGPEALVAGIDRACRPAVSPAASTPSRPLPWPGQRPGSGSPSASA